MKQEQTYVELDKLLELVLYEAMQQELRTKEPMNVFAANCFALEHLKEIDNDFLHMFINLIRSHGYTNMTKFKARMYRSLYKQLVKERNMRLRGAISDLAEHNESGEQ